MADKPRVRVQANSQPRQFTADNFQNFQAQLGYGTQNLTSGSTYGFNPISRNHTLLEWMYRGSWLCKKVVDCPADDMTREGIQIESDMPPDRIDALTQYWNELQIWQRMNETLKWARLYGGALGVMMIEGQKLDTPLRIDTVAKGQFKGILVLDRWMVWPHIENTVDDFGSDFGLPKFYDVVADARSLPNMRIHHSRCLRMDGVSLPYWQRIAENLWGLSVIEPLFDRMIAFDSATQGAAQLIYKAHLRVLKIQDYRENIASMGKAHQAVLAQLNMIRMMQTNEGLTVLDREDEFQANSYSFAGLSDMMVQFSQQVSGAADVPMTRLFGQSPAGMNATGESDLRNYYDGIKSQQEGRLRRYITMLLNLSHRSLFGVPLPDGFNYSFSPLWQNTEVEQSQIAGTIATATSTLFQDGILSQKTAMKEIRQWSRITGFGSNITDEEISAIPDGPPTPMMGEVTKAEAEGANKPPPMPGMPGKSGAENPAMSQAAAGEHTPLARGVVPLGPDVPGHGLHEAKEDDQAPIKPLTPEGRHEAAHEGQSSKGTEFEQRAESAEKFWEKYEKRMEMADSLPVIDVGPLHVIIETQKGESRVGYGWSTVMPAHYGYISGTSSAEGPAEQFDAFVGEDPQSDQVWIVSQKDLGTGKFDEHKAILGCHSRDEAMRLYHAAFSDGRGSERVGNVREMTVETLHAWLSNHWQYGKPNGKDETWPSVL